MLKTFAILAWIVSGFSFLGVIGDSEYPDLALQLMFAGLLSGAFMWAFGSVQEDVRAMRKMMEERSVPQPIPQVVRVPEEPQLIKCHNCGVRNAPESRYCKHCRERL